MIGKNIYKNNMKIKYNKSKMILIFISIILTMLFLNVSYAQSESIESIDVYATIMKNGDIMVSQKWKTYTNKGTEYYIPFSNLNGMEITNFHVSDLNGEYQNIGTNWDIDASFEEKARKCGINTNTTKNDFELCFGKSVRGENIYTVNFTYKNAVRSFSDYDGFNIMFINRDMEPAPKNVSVNLQLEDGTPLSKENAGIWAFGYNGEIIFDEGKAVAKNTSSFTSNSSVIIMMKFNKGLLNPVGITSNESFDTMKSEAIENSKYNNYKKEGNFENFSRFFPFIIMWILMLGGAIKIDKTLVKGKGVTRKKYPYWREKIYDANILLLHLTQTGESFKNLISAQMLKWIKQGVIEITKQEIEVRKILSTTTKTEDVIHILKNPEFESEFEEDFFEYLIIAKGDKDYTRKEDLKRIIREDSEVFSALITNAKIEARKLAYENGYIDKNIRKFKLTEKGIEEAERYYGYTHFLDDFTLMNEKQSIEVHIWDEILIIATAIGKGEKVLKEFKEIAPDYEFANGIDTYNTWIILNSYSDTAYNTYTQSSYNGYGGSSSFSGGGGFSGGGSGGGGR